MPGGSFFSFTASLQISRRQAAVLLPGAAAHLQRAVTVAGDPQQAHGGRLVWAALGQGELPPHTLDADEAALVLDRLAKLLVDDSHLRSGRRFVVPDTSKAEEIARKFRLLGMEYEGSVHFEGSAEKEIGRAHV